jgi:hypothetical protein
MITVVVVVVVAVAAAADVEHTELSNGRGKWMDGWMETILKK